MFKYPLILLRAMIKAEIILKTGEKMTIEGSPEDILAVKAKIEENYTKNNSFKSLAHNKQKSIKIKNKGGPLSRVLELVNEDFFKERRDIGAIKKKLEEKGRIYAINSISPALLRLVRKKAIRRLKENNKWAYVNA